MLVLKHFFVLISVNTQWYLLSNTFKPFFCLRSIDSRSVFCKPSSVLAGAEHPLKPCWTKPDVLQVQIIKRNIRPITKREDL
jgi:hypothetical protein